MKVNKGACRTFVIVFEKYRVPSIFERSRRRGQVVQPQQNPLSRICGLERDQFAMSSIFRGALHVRIPVWEGGMLWH